MRLFLWALLACGLTACATVKKDAVEKDIVEHLGTEKPVSQVAPKKVHRLHIEDLMRYSSRFLYLGAQTALQEQHRMLALQFLEALNQKLKRSKEDEEKWSIEPRLQLVQLWLQNERLDESRVLLGSLLAHVPLAQGTQKEDVLRLFTMYARVLAAQHQYAEALDELTRLLSVSPDFLPARRLQIALFMETKRWELAHIAIQTAIQRHDTAALRKLDANVFVHEKKYAQALTSLQQMQRLAPNDADVPLLQSEIALKQGHEKEAKGYLKTFLTSHPDDLQVKNKLGALYIRLGETSQAIQLYQELATQMPERAEISSALGVLFYQQKQIKQAVKYFERAYQLEPKGQGHAFYLAASLEWLGEKKKARSLYQKVPEGDGLWVESQLRLAGMDFVEKNFDQVQQDMLALVKDFPDESHAWILLSSSYLNQRKYQELLDHTQAGVMFKKPSPRLMLNRAIALEHFKRYDDVEVTLKKVLKFYPKDTEALNFLGYTYAEQGVKLGEAEAYIQRALTLKPKDGYYLDSLAWVYYQQGNYQQAIQTQRQSLVLVSDDATMQEHLGDMLWKHGEHAAAVKQWQLALTLKPENPKSLHHKVKHGL
ncbi:MAG: tetratricopeptide repeat protein [Mariprofundaceae bacterium]|nr:tetratricopeptide repeat protein [Mariprofundaceae bacterium]